MVLYETFTISSKMDAFVDAMRLSIQNDYILNAKYTARTQSQNALKKIFSIMKR